MVVVVVVVYPTHSWGWGRRSTQRRPINGATPNGRDQRSKMERECRIWPDAYGRVQGSLARDGKGPVIQNHGALVYAATGTALSLALIPTGLVF